MPFRIEVALKPGYRDAAGEGVKSAIKDNLGIAAESVRAIKCTPSTRS